MENRTLRVIEYDKIINILSGYAISEAGKKMAASLVPLTNPKEIILLQQETSEAQHILLTKGSLPMGPIHEVASYAKKASIGSMLDPRQLLMINDTLRTARRIQIFLKNIEDIPILSGLSQQITSLKTIEDEIENAIISEEEISDNASHELRKIRASMTSIKEQIRQKLQSMVSSENYAKYLQESIVTMRQERFVLPVKAENKASIPGIVHDSSSSGATLFIEPMVIVELNNKLRENKIKETEEIERILMTLSAMVGEHHLAIDINEKVLSQIDFIFAKGKLSVDFKGQEPVINQQKILELKNARHPLLDKKTVVPLNLSIGKEYDTLVITGPNTGGKTVAIKTVGLLCAMGQSGLHLPADYGTSICIFDQIFADIGDEQSIQQSLSTFSSHMTHIVSILQDITDSSLVLFDELGAGTDPLEGAALAMAILENLRKRGITTIATTHYSELKHYALGTSRVRNASVEFDINTLSPTYKLVIGIPGKSNAFEISKKLGLDKDIIDSAKVFLDSDDIAMEDVLREIEKSKKIAEENRQQTEELLNDARIKEQKINNREARLEEQKDKILQDAKREARQIIGEAKDTSDQLVKKIRNLQQQTFDKDLNKNIELTRNELNESLKKYHIKGDEIIKKNQVINPVRSIQPGDNVYVPSFEKEGTVIVVDSDKKEALVQLGILKINLPIQALEQSREKEKEIHSTGAGKILKSKAMNVATELDIRGLDMETARIEVEKYLDNVILSGIPRVTIIHGLGTMVLKKGVKELLRKNKHVKSQRDGIYGEGGSGVTIVELKN